MATPKKSTPAKKTNTYITDAELESVDTVEDVTPARVAKSESTFGEKLQTARNTKQNRILFIVALLVILFLLWWFKIIKTGFAVGIGLLLAVALGIETIDYDLDLGTLWKTGNIQESRVQHTKDGIVLKGSCINSKKENDLNCSNFKTQADAQAKYDQCATQVASYNAGKTADQIKNLDIYGLDGNKNGVVCEHLPKVAPAM